MVVWYHVLPALVVFAGVAAVLLFGLAVFELVFLIDDEFDTGAFLVGVAFQLGTAAGVSLAAFVLGLVLDRLTSAASGLVRLAAPAPLPLAGVLTILVGSDPVGIYLLVLGAVFCGYWAVLLLQGFVGRLARRAWARVTGERLLASPQ